jgi:hypothetical protein
VKPEPGGTEERIGSVPKPSTLDDFEILRRNPVPGRQPVLDDPIIPITSVYISQDGLGFIEPVLLD